MRPFAAPQMLWLLLILVVPLSAFFWWAWRRRQQLITQFISERLLNHLKVGVSPQRQKARMVIFTAAIVFLILALARPQWGVTREEARQRGLDIVVAIDTSNSMLAEDVSPNRLARAKLAALDLMRRAKTDRLGLVAFAGAAYLQCPLTLDDAAFSQSVDSLDTKTISQGGTAIAEAIDEAGKAFKDESDNHRVLVLFTDGEDQDSEAVKAAEKAAKNGMIIFTIGIGTPEGELLRVRDDRGRMDYIRDEQGNPVKSHLNEELLQQIARTTKEGFYLPLQGTKTMDNLYDHGIAPLPKSEKSVRMFQNYHEQFHWPLGIALALLILEMFLPDRKRRRSQPSAAAPASAGSLAGTAAVLLLLAVPMAARGSPSSALREYNEGKYQDALRDYNQLLEKKKDDPRLHFNAGTAAYQSQQFDEAAKQLNAALASPDLLLQQRAYYNLGNSLYRQGQQLPDAAKKQEAWENAMKQYESALKLNQQDADAKFNQEFVQKQLEELKKQQQQQKQQSKNNSDKQQKQDQKDQSKNDSQKDQNKDSQDQQKQQDQQNQDKSQPGQNQNSEAKNQENEKKSGQDQKKADQSEAKKQKDEAEKNNETAQNQASGESKDKSEEEAKREAAMMAAGEMTPQQARQLLDAEKDDEQVLRLAPPNKNISRGRSFKNW
ncbi:MAG TPA: VWA domain-containing protein [Verrucomicrobiae bacterium]|nr:VWA domain-containing protein [Verrucomicrobiae bacterium]